MTTRWTILLCPLLAIPLWAQEGGLTPAWDIRKTLASLVEQTTRLGPILDGMRPQEWADKGAPAGYVGQLQTVRNEVGYLSQNVGEMSKDPERMTATLDVFLRLQSLESMLNSLGEGLRRYQNAAMADQLQSVIGENSANRSRLRDYLVELVGNKEAELRIMGQEAERCRDQLIRQPPPRRP